MRPHMPDEAYRGATVPITSEHGFEVILDKPEIQAV